MAIAFDAITLDQRTGGDPIQFNHTPVDVPRAVIVFTARTGDATSDLVSVTYGGDSLTEISSSPLEKSTGENCTLTCWFKGSGIATGTQQVSVDLSSATNHEVACITLTADADTEVHNSANHQNDLETDPTEALAKNGNTCWVGQAVFSGRGTTTGFTAKTNWSDHSSKADWGPNCTGFFTYDTIDSTDEALGFNQAVADDTGMLGLAVKEVAAVAQKRLLTLLGAGT